MISGVMIVKSGEKVQLVPDYKPTNLLFFHFTFWKVVGVERGWGFFIIIYESLVLILSSLNALRFEWNNYSVRFISLSLYSYLYVKPVVLCRAMK